MNRSASQALILFLIQNTTFGRADLCTISLPNGQTLNVLWGTNTDITFNGVTYYSSQNGSWERGVYENAADFRPSAGSWELKALLPITLNYPGTTTPFIQAMNQGMLNGAIVSVQTLYWPLVGMSGYNAQNPPAGGFSMGTMKLTVGQIGNVKPAGRSKVVCEVYDGIYWMNKPVPPHMIQSQCRHILFDAGCTLVAANFTSQAIALGTGSGQLYLNLVLPTWAGATPYLLGNIIYQGDVVYVCTLAGTSGGGLPTFNPTRGAVTTDGAVRWTSFNGQYPLGYVTFTSGQNAGLKASIKAATQLGVMQLQLAKMLPFPVSIGDHITMSPGCDKSLSLSGCAGYSNQLHYGGDPYVPSPEKAYA